MIACMATLITLYTGRSTAHALFNCVKITRCEAGYPWKCLQHQNTRGTIAVSELVWHFAIRHTDTYNDNVTDGCYLNDR